MDVTPLRILLVEDDAALQRLLDRWLQKAGQLVESVSDGLQAMRSIQENCPHILITDWDIPTINGLDLCRWVRTQQLPNYLYTIFLTGRTASSDTVTALEVGADDFMRKPVDQSELLARIRAGRRVLDLERRLNQLACTDPLTGVSTRRTFFELLNREWSRAQRNGEPISCVMVDIDYFKRVNDTYGHRAGDQALRSIAGLIRQNCRQSDIVGRYGGEEFCVALPNASEEDAHRWAERLRIAVNSRLGIVENQQAVRLSASFGVAQRLHDTSSPEDLVELADQALLVAKRSGRDRVVAFRSISNNTGIRDRAGGLVRLLEGVTARDVMARIVVGLQHDDSVESAVRYFLRFRVHSAPVVDDQGKLVGILTEHEVMSLMLLPGWWRTQISEVMKSNVVCYDENTPVSTIYEFLSRVAMRGVVIVTDGRPTGVISRACLLRWFTNLLAVGSLKLPPEDGNAEESGPAEVTPPKLLAAEPSDMALRVAEMMAQEAQGLAGELKAAPADWLPMVVAGVSRVEELVTDLLAHVRDASTAPSTDRSNGLIQATGLANAAMFGQLTTVAD